MTRRLPRDEQGTTLVEFAIVAPVLLLMIMGFFDLTHRAYVQTVLQGAVEEAGRSSTLQTGTVDLEALDAKVEEQVRPTIGSAASFSSRRVSYSNFSDIGEAEIYRDNKPANGRYDVGECFEDMNRNGRWDDSRGAEGSQGGAQDVAVYETSVTYPRLFPMAGMLGWSTTQTVTGSTVLRNQPWAAQNGVTVCP